MDVKHKVSTFYSCLLVDCSWLEQCWIWSNHSTKLKKSPVIFWSLILTLKNKRTNFILKEEYHLKIVTKIIPKWNVIIMINIKKMEIWMLVFFLFFISILWTLLITNLFSSNPILLPFHIFLNFNVQCNPAVSNLLLSDPKAKSLWVNWAYNENFVLTMNNLQLKYNSIHN